MAHTSRQLDDERSRVKRCQQGDVEALHWLRDQCHPALTHILLSRGASRTEADDLLADLWADCVPGGDDRPCLLKKFSGRCTLLSWLATVATRRWIDLKRRQMREVAHGGFAHPDESPFEGIPAPALSASEHALVGLLRDSLHAAFALCSPEGMVLLRLRYLHTVSQRDLVRMLGWHESKVSRTLSQAMQEIKTHTLREIKRRDPWLDLTWQDFLD
jgi:RNA polymerase sigma factor (sigma-70 family)